MFADDEEMGTPGDETEGAAETMNMSDSADEKPAKAKKEKKPGDWITVETPKISKADAVAAKKEAAAAPKSAAPAPSPMEATMMDAPSTGATATPASTSAASPSAPMVESASGGSSVPLGGMLANMGVKDEKTQKIIVYAGGGVIALCCLCSCAAVAINFVLPMLGN
jgi:hypothetical protein